MLINKFGCRAVSIAGSLISSLGFVAASFSTSVWMMTLTYGFMGGTCAQEVTLTQILPVTRSRVS